MLENVEEFKTWGPLLKDGKPDPDKKGRTFNCFINALRRQGYKVEWKELRACDYGAPTIRKRFFMVARCDSKPIVWPKPTHGDPKSVEVKSGKLKPWRNAAEIIDWSLPCPSIFKRKKPLAENTMRRIAKGIKKFVIDDPKPFIIKVNHQGEQFRGQKITEPIQTITSKNGWGIVTPYIARIGQTGFGGDRMQYPLEQPLTTITSKAEHLLVTPFLTQYHSYDHNARGQSLDKPILTLDTSNRYGLVKTFLTTYYGNENDIGQNINEPLRTVTARDRFGVVSVKIAKADDTRNLGNWDRIRGILNKYCGYKFAEDEILLISIDGIYYFMYDIGMRMLEPHELFAAQGFPEDYIINQDNNGKRYPKTAQVAKCGNAVPPPFAEHLVRANLPELCTDKKNEWKRQLDLNDYIAG